MLHIECVACYSKEIYIMRLFSQKEKRIIRQLVVESSNSTIYLPINAFNDIFVSRDIGFDSTTEMDLVFPYNATGIPSHEELIAVYNDVLERALLIDYLEKDGLVYLVPASTSVNSLTTVGNVVRLNRISMQIDSSIGDILLKCMNRPLYVSETLKQYVESDFKSLEELSLDESKNKRSIVTGLYYCLYWQSLFLFFKHVDPELNLMNRM